MGLRTSLRTLAVGGTVVSDVRIRRGEDAEGDAALFVVLVLKNPEGETWPIDDIWELRRIARERISPFRLDSPWFLELEPEEPDELDPDDIGEQVVEGE